MLKQRRWIAAGLFVSTFATFASSVRHGFVDVDDGTYVSQNADVLRGLSSQSVRWAFETGRAATWHPLTWLSHLLDVSLFGTWAGGHHLMSVLLHALAVVFVFLALA